MNLDYKRVLYLNLEEQTFEFKIHKDLWEYIGGIGISYKLLVDNFESSPIIVSSGPLSGYFPYISKANLLYLHDGRIMEKYGGGSLASNMNAASIDGVIIFGKPSGYLKVSIYEREVSFSKEEEESFSKASVDLVLTNKSAMSLDYFSFGNIQNIPFDVDSGVSLKIDFSRSVDLKDFYDYENLYNSFLDQYKDLTVEPRNNPSCFGCPMGCDKSSQGEDDLNIGVLPRCLISCGYAEEIYKNIPNVYAALNSVGYKYHHSHLESLPKLVGELKTKLATYSL